MSSPYLSLPLSILLSVTSLTSYTQAEAVPQVISPAPSTIPSTTSGDGSPYCVPFKFTSNDPNWTWKRNGLCGGGGQGDFSDNGNADCCFSGSGAMFVSPLSRGLGDKNYGNTIIECTIASSPEGQSVCDISLIDGFSLAVSCGEFPSGDPQGRSQGAKNPNPTIGGSVDLSTLGHECRTPCKMGEDCTSCLNDGHGAMGQVDAFFQEARGGKETGKAGRGGNYWVQDGEAGKTTFIGRPESGVIQCHVGPKEETNHIVEETQGNGQTQYPGGTQVQRRHPHVHKHVERKREMGIHARRLHNLVGSVAKVHG